MPLNDYGDSPTPTTGVHGVDIASQRLDDLDRACLEFALDCTQAGQTAIDLGCGLGAQSLRLASLGWKVWMCDLLDLGSRVNSINAILGAPHLHFLCKDARQLASRDLPTSATMLYSQRFIHYLTYSEAVSVLRLISTCLQPRSQLFLSASGLHSELGGSYPCSSHSLETRFAKLNSSTAKKTPNP